MKRSFILIVLFFAASAKAHISDETPLSQIGGNSTISVKLKDYNLLSRQESIPLCVFSDFGDDNVFSKNRGFSLTMDVLHPENVDRNASITLVKNTIFQRVSEGKILPTDNKHGYLHFNTYSEDSGSSFSNVGPVSAFLFIDIENRKDSIINVGQLKRRLVECMGIFNTKGNGSLAIDLSIAGPAGNINDSLNF